MSQIKLTQRLLRDLKTSAPKTAVLGLLLLVGLYFWVPPLLKAFSSNSAVAPAPAATASTSTPAGGVSTVGTTSTSANPAATSKKSHDSAAIAKLIHEHPLLQIAKADDMPERPFGLDQDALPLPVEIADDSLAEPPPPPSPPKAAPIVRLEGLTLKSTLVGPTRRAAMINNRLYQEGQSVTWNDRQLQLESVTRKAVTLTDGSQKWQLTLKGSRGESEE
jgi:hypothetical protein